MDGEKEEFIELINNTLKSYLSSCELDKKISTFEILSKISTFEILSEKIELSLNTLTQNYEAKIANLEKENIKLHARMNELEQYSRRNSIRLYMNELEQYSRRNSIRLYGVKEYQITCSYE
ncbi:hypothetical protein QE152_g41540 [Popillia japonica]|uniref:Uncharacterized protein n=1 Tax=Popillia japonica TaxID=7064 RepID=A0AAW1G9D9_POPJA